MRSRNPGCLPRAAAGLAGVFHPSITWSSVFYLNGRYKKLLEMAEGLWGWGSVG